MKTSIWAACPKCQAELKIETDETELVQIECPDCHKVFAAKVPPRPVRPERDIFAQAPVLPPFQPANVHYRSRPRSRSGSDDSLSPVAVTALIVVCASAILIPLGFGAYYVYGKLTESVELAMASSAPVASTPTPDEVEPSQGADLSSSDGSSFAVRDLSPPMPNMGSNTNPSIPTTPSFPTPELNPPPILQPDLSTPPSTPDVSRNMSPSQFQVDSSGAQSSDSGLSPRLKRFSGPNGVLIFVLHSRGTSFSMNDLVRSLSIQDSHVEQLNDHTMIGLSYSGNLDNVVKQIQFGKVSYIDEESRTIHVQAN